MPVPGGDPGPARPLLRARGMARMPTLVADPTPEGLARLRRALALDDAYGLDGSLGDVLLTVPPGRAGRLRVDGRRLPSGNRALLGGEVLRHGRLRVRLRPPPRTVAPSGTRTLARAALSRGFVGDVVPGPCLAVLEGPSAGRRWPLAPGAHRLGRGLDADIVVVDPAVSRHHGVVEVDAAGRVRLRDASSRNGLRVGRRRLQGWRALKGGEEIIAGRTRLRYLPGPPARAPARAPARTPAGAPGGPSPDGPGPARRRPGDGLWLAAAAGLLVGGALVSAAVLAG